MPDLKVCYEAITMVQNGTGTKHKDQWKRLEASEGSQESHRHLVFEKVSKIYAGKKRLF